MTVEDARGLSLAMDDLCQECHTEIAVLEHDGVHEAARERGELAAASCADCHGSHNIQSPNEPRERVSTTCGNCHSTINEVYAESVHGAALLGEHNPDVPVCIDCHGVHNMQSPRTAEFRVTSPDMCADCHADEALMAKYDISTNVFDTYVADFHGTTVALFEKQTPWQETNKAVCYDCRGGVMGKVRERYQRFDRGQRIEHGLLILSFTLLSVTGLPQKYPDTAWGEWFIRLMGGIETTRWFHHFAAILLILGSIYHVAVVGYRLLCGGWR